MSINWFTFFAQMINFLVLVWLLKRFLYAPITKAMTEREQKIAAKLNDADAARQEAEQQGAAHRAKIQELEQTREKLFAEATSEVQLWREEKIQLARSDVEKSRSEWYQGLVREQELLIKELQRRTADHVHQLARKVLLELADAKLEEQAISVFLDHLKKLETLSRQELVNALSHSEQTVHIGSAFPLSPEQQAEIVKVIREEYDVSADLEFVCRPKYICGIELSTPGSKLSWTLNETLKTLEEDLTHLLETGLSANADQQKMANSHAKMIPSSSS